jgi:mannose-1-phosphate guanylyltransferase/mannose-6-phosphate isomerase
MPESKATQHDIPIYPVLLAGGTGTRLWPVSRQLYPKQLVKFIGNDSLIQNTIKRIMPMTGPENIRIICGIEHFHEISRHAREAGVDPEGRVIVEPCGRNTAPAVLLALFRIANLQDVRQEAAVCVFPADHVIEDAQKFREKVAAAVDLAMKGYIVTFGITPSYPETGYGYIEAADPISGEALAVRQFVEKPDKATAEEYIRAGRFFWNSGMFTFKLSVIMEEFRRLVPDLYGAMAMILSENRLPTKAEYECLPDISIDYAIMEKTDKVVVLPSDFGWSDIGSWKSLFDFLPKDDQHNVIDGDVIAQDTRNCFILGRDRLVAVNHLENIVVVDTPDSVFVSDMRNSRDVKSIVSMLKESGRKEFYRHNTIHHPWGTVTGLEKTEAFAVDRICVFPSHTAGLHEAAPESDMLTVLTGRPWICVNGLCGIVLPGYSVNLTHPCDATIQNPESGAAQVLAIRLVNRES